MDCVEVERLCVWIRHGVALRVPRATMPDCDTERSSLHWVGWEGVERRDEWRAREPGHGIEGGTERTRLSRDELRRALAAWREDEVAPLVPQGGPGLVALGEVLPRVLAGEEALLSWFDTAEGASQLLVGDGEAYWWVQRRGARLERVERWEPERLEALAALRLPASAVGLVPPGLVEEARGRMARHEALAARLREDPGARLLHWGKVWLARGERFPFVIFWEEPTQPRPYLSATDEWGLQATIAGALSEDPGAAVAPFPAALRAALRPSEEALFARCEGLRRGELMFHSDPRRPRYQLWLDGTGYEVVLAGGPPRVEKVLPGGPDASWLAHAVQQGGPDPRLFVVPPGLVAALRARLASAR